MFRTPTGQTSTDAYIYEAAQISNHLRELNARAARLVDAMIDEMPADASCLVSIASEQYPDATRTADRDALVSMLQLNTTAADAKLLAQFARGIASSDDYADDYVVDMSADR
jgi:hypothetical protein